MKKAKKHTSFCPCGSRTLYRRCCKPLILGRAAPNAEALMRSRYTAYTLGRTAYLIDSTHPSGPHWRADTTTWKQELDDWCAQTTFEGLHIIKTTQNPLAGEAHVTFLASLSSKQQDLSFQEKSLFKRHEGRWKYVEGSTCAPPSNEPHVEGAA